MRLIGAMLTFYGRHFRANRPACSIATEVTIVVVTVAKTLYPSLIKCCKYFIMYECLNEKISHISQVAIM